jgi:hypothetical protein
MTHSASFRLVCGLFVAALWLPVLLLATSGPYGKFWFLMTAFYTVPLTLIVAAPLVYFFRHRLSLLSCLACGLGVGFLGALTFLSTTNYLAALNWGPALIVSGVVSSLLFWIVGVWGNGGLTIVGGVRDAR